MTTTLFATISPRKNSHWHGRGQIVSIDIKTGVVILKMLTGKEKDRLGGFSLDMLSRIRVVRVEQCSFTFNDTKCGLPAGHVGGHTSEQALSPV